MPDIFVPADTSDITPYYTKVYARNLLYKYTIEYSDRHRQELNNITSIGELDAFFAKDPGLFDGFVQYAARGGVAPVAADINRSKALMLAQLKAYIGRNTPLEENAFYYELQHVDNVVVQALNHPDILPKP